MTLFPPYMGSFHTVYGVFCGEAFGSCGNQSLFAAAFGLNLRQSVLPHPDRICGTPQEQLTPRAAAQKRPSVYGQEVYDPLDEVVAATPPSMSRGGRAASRVSPAAGSQAKQLFPEVPVPVPWYQLQHEARYGGA